MPAEPLVTEIHKLNSTNERYWILCSSDIQTVSLRQEIELSGPQTASRIRKYVWTLCERA
jgi:hypothetical protein